MQSLVGVRGEMGEVVELAAVSMVVLICRVRSRAADVASLLWPMNVILIVQHSALLEEQHGDCACPQVVTLIPGQTPNSSLESVNFQVSGGRKSVLSPDRENDQTITVYQIYHQKAAVFIYSIGQKNTPNTVYDFVTKKRRKKSYTVMGLSFRLQRLCSEGPTSPPKLPRHPAAPRSSLGLDGLGCLSRLGGLPVHKIDV